MSEWEGKKREREREGERERERYLPTYRACIIVKRNRE